MLDPIFFLLLLLASSASSQCDDAKIMAKFDQLEVRLRDQEIQLKKTGEQIILLKEQVKRLESSLGTKDVGKKVAPSAAFTPRTCKEALDSGLPEFKESGMYWIDPDGLGIGVEPIYVFCNMTTGITSMGHDSESIISIPKCSNPGCYSKAISYQNASLLQMKALAEISADCSQSIWIDCVGGPLTLGGVDYAWWEDVDGQIQNFWSGSDNTKHTCQCGIDNKCIDINTADPQLKCNCDANVAIRLNDNGVITLKEVLPVTKLYFGNTKFDGGSHKLGKFECSGTSRNKQLPTSCRELWRTGHTLNGFYPVKKYKKIEFAYCDFTPGQNVVEKPIGYVDVKSMPVHFYVERSTSFSEQMASITFDIERVNEGNAMNLDTGIFIAPKLGVYSFDFSAVSSSTESESNVVLFVNNSPKGSTMSNYPGEATVNLPSMWRLNRGDQVTLKLLDSKGKLYSSSFNYYTHFTGHLLEEEIDFS